MTPTGREARVAEAYQAALVLVYILKNAPPASPEGYADLRLAALRATVKARDAAPFWVGQPPEWSPEAVSVLEAIVFLGRRLTCLAAAAARVQWNAEDFREAITREWEAVQRAVAEHFKPVSAGTLEGGLLREVRDTAERPVNPIARPQWSDGGWLGEMINAYDLLTAEYENCDTTESEQHESPKTPDTPPSDNRHADGPEDPCWLWWGNVRHELAPRLWQILDHLWNRDKVSVEDLVSHVWSEEGEEIKDPTVRSYLSRLNTRLNEIGVPREYNLRRGHICRA
jgi:hypothetical protein